MERDYADQYGELYRRHWWWRAREAIVLKRIADLPLPPKARILDVGCGDGLLFPGIERYGAVEGIEVDESLLRPDGPYRQVISTAPLGDPEHEGKRFDLILALDVIEHIEDDRTAVQAMASMLRPDGFLILTVPALMSLWDSHDDVNRHYRRYTTRGLRQLIAEVLRVLDCRYLFPSLYLPKLAVAILNRHRSRAVVQHGLPPAPLNSLARFWCRIDGALSRRVKVPFGSSVLLVAAAPPA